WRPRLGVVPAHRILRAPQAAHRIACFHVPAPVFPLTYTTHELRRRLGRTILTALGLAAGVGLVIGIVGVSQGLDDAQGRVLAPLSKVGTDVLVTRVAGAPAGAPSDAPSTSTTVPADGNGRAGRGAGGFFGGGGGPG